MAIFQCFEPSLDDPKPPLPTPDRVENSSTRFLMLSALDIIGLIGSLYPDRLHLPGAQVGQEVDVAPPSTAGSSTLNASTSDSGSALASSSAPSTSGTSVISRTIVSENLTDDASAGKQDSHDTSTAEFEQLPPKSSNFVKREFPLLLRSICRRLTSSLGRGGSSEPDFSRTAWIFIDYSSDGTTLTLSPLEIRKSRDSETGDAVGDLEALKTGVVKLLSHCAMSDFLEGGELGSVEGSHISDQSDPLANLMKASMESAQSNLQFSTAHYWWQTLGIYSKLISSTEPRTAYSSLLRDIAEDLQRRLEAATQAAKVSELRLRSLENLRQHQTHLLATVEGQRKALRVKMWYSSDVIHSGTYEEALHVTRALRAMVSSKRAKQPASMANWARQRLRGSAAFARPEIQTLEAISAPKDYGGQSKLADEQIEITSRWLTRRSIENFCKGEERIHRFCFEVQKSINKMAGPSSIKNPVLWSSSLFRREKASFDAQRSMLMSGAYTSPIAGLFSSLSLFEHSRFNNAVLDPSDLPVKGLGGPKARPASNSFGTFWSTTQPSPAFTGFGHGTPSPLPPTPTSPPRTWSSKPFTSTSSLQGPIQFPSQASFGDRTSHSINEAELLPGKVAFAEDVKTSLRSLLISDLGCLLWKQGSETDAWINDCMPYQSENEAEEKRLGSKTAPYLVGKDESSENVHHPDRPSNGIQSLNLHSRDMAISLAGPNQDKKSVFPFLEAYAMLLQKMSLSPDPRAKLQSLYELEDLITKSLHDSSKPYDTAIFANLQSGQQPSEVGISPHGKSTPRTKATSLEEVVANCTERRAGTLKSKDRRNGFTHLNTQQLPTTAVIHGTDDIVNSFLLIFRDTKLRPLTLFRDLQYIAAFIPSETLDQTAQGKAFWNAGLAALALKEDLCGSIINRANQITAYHISPSKSTDPLADIDLANTTLRDAANLWLITAKEGSPAAARELGLFYLTHPELLPRVTMPFSKAKDVYKSVTSIDARIGDKEKGALDRATFAVVFHWMEFAANGGDKDARDFLKGTGELSGGRR